MVKKRKLFERMVNSQKNVKFSQLLTIIEAFGFELDRIKGSHHIYKHPDVVEEFLSLQPDNAGKAKPYRVRQFLSLVEEYNLRLGSESEEETEE